MHLFHITIFFKNNCFVSNDCWGGQLYGPPLSPRDLRLCEQQTLLDIRSSIGKDYVKKFNSTFQSMSFGLQWAIFLSIALFTYKTEESSSKLGNGISNLLCQPSYLLTFSPSTTKWMNLMHASNSNGTSGTWHSSRRGSSRRSPIRQLHSRDSAYIVIGQAN